MAKPIRRKLLIAGDGACGKTCLLTVFSRGEFPEQFLPAIHENYIANVEVDGKYIELVLWDTTGQDGYERLRPLYYLNSHVILISFAIDQPESLEKVVEKWVPEILHFCSDPKVPYIVVGLKKDLRTDRRTVEMLERIGERPVTEAQGREVAQRVGAMTYFECSAKNHDGVLEVFDYAARAALLMAKSKKNKRGCRIL